MYADVKLRDKAGAVSGYISRIAKPGASKLLFNSMASTTPFEMGRELDAVSALRPRVKKAIVHMVLSLSPDEEITDRLFVEMALEVRKRFGLSDTQVAVWRHSDTANPHIHVLMNRVSPSGEVSSMWGKQKVLRQFCDDMRQQHGFRKPEKTGPRGQSLGM